MTRLPTTVVCAAFVLAALPARAVDIVAPAAGTTFSPGATLSVRVAPSAGEQLTAVAVGIGATSVQAVASGVVTGAFDAQITVPAAAVGPQFIIAYASLAGGSVGIDYLDINVEPGPVRQLTLSAPSGLSTVGAVFPLRVQALFADGVTRDVTLPEKGTTYQSSDETVLGIHATGLIQARASGAAIVRASNRGQSVTRVIQVSIPNPPTNHIPIADPGPDQIVAPKTLVTLSAVASSDPDGDPLTYQWEQESGRVVLLRTPQSAQTVFVSPRVDVQEVLEFSLVVSDNKGATTFPAIVRVTVRP